MASSCGQWMYRSTHFAAGKRYFAAILFIGLGVSAALTTSIVPVGA